MILECQMDIYKKIKQNLFHVLISPLHLPTIIVAKEHNKNFKQKPLLQS